MSKEPDIKEIILDYDSDIIYMIKRLKKLEAVAVAAKNVRFICEELMPNSGHMYLKTINDIHLDLNIALNALEADQ